MQTALFTVSCREVGEGHGREAQQHYRVHLEEHDRGLAGNGPVDSCKLRQNHLLNGLWTEEEKHQFMCCFVHNSFPGLEYESSDWGFT